MGGRRRAADADHEDSPESRRISYELSEDLDVLGEFERDHQPTRD